MFKKIKLEKPLLLIFLLALFLRLLGIWHGWPFIYNVDEPALVRSAVGIRFSINPGHFDWPHLHFYLTFAVLSLAYCVRGFFQVTSLRPLVESIAPFFWQDPAVYYLITRILNASLGALTVVPVYLAGKALFNKKVGLLAALALAVIPFHVQDSHMATVDIPLTFWLAWSFYFSARVFKEGNGKNYLLAGVFSGLAASTKYNGILVLLCVALAHVLRIYRESGGHGLVRPGRMVRLVLSRELLKPIVSLLVALLFFFIGTPFALLDFDTFWSFDYPKGVLWQFLNIGQVGSWSAFLRNGSKVLVEFFPQNLSIPFWLITLWSLFGFLFLPGRTAEQALLVVFPVLYSLLVIRGAKFSSHYFLPCYPFFALVVGRFSARLGRGLGKDGPCEGAFLGHLQRWFKERPVLAERTGLSVIALLLIFSPAVCLSLREDIRFARADTRTMASRWVDEEIPSGGVGAIIGTENIEIVRDGVEEDYIRDLSLLKDFEKYDFLIVTKTDRSFAVEKLSQKGFSLAKDISSAGRRGPDIYIFKRE